MKSTINTSSLVMLVTSVIVIVVAIVVTIPVMSAPRASLLETPRCRHRAECSTGGRSRMMDASSVKDRNCACDRQCNDYNDCCANSKFRRVPDAESASDDTASPAQHQWTCLETNTPNVNVYVKSTCPEYSEDIESMRKMGQAAYERLVNQCDSFRTSHSGQPTNTGSGGSLLASKAPITDTSDGKTYANSHCLLCNQLVSRRTANRRSNSESNSTRESPSYASQRFVYWSPTYDCDPIFIRSVVRRTKKKSNSSSSTARQQANIQVILDDSRHIELSNDDRDTMIDMIRDTHGVALVYWPPIRKYMLPTLSSWQEILSDGVLKADNLAKFHYPHKDIERNNNFNYTNMKEPMVGCEVVFDHVPDSLTHMVRNCRPEVVDQCPLGMNDNRSQEKNQTKVQQQERLRNECELGAQSLVYSSETKRVYFNPACATCHNDTRLDCELPARGRAVYHAKQVGASLTVLLDLYGKSNDQKTGAIDLCASPNSSDSSSSSSSESSTHSTHKIWDPNEKTCRDVLCGVDQVWNEQKASCDPPDNSTVRSQRHHPDDRDTVIVELNNLDTIPIITLAAPTTTTTAAATTTIATSTISTISNELLSVTSGDLSTETNPIGALTTTVATTTESTFVATETTESLESDTSIDSTPTMDRRLTSTIAPTSTSTSTLAPSTTTAIISTIIATIQTTPKPNINGTHNSVKPALTRLDFRRCDGPIITTSDYRLSSNQSILSTRVFGLNLTLDSDQFKLIGSASSPNQKQALLCWSQSLERRRTANAQLAAINQLTNSGRYVSKFDHTLAVLTLIGLGASIVALILYLLLYWAQNSKWGTHDYAHAAAAAKHRREQQQLYAAAAATQKFTYLRDKPKTNRSHSASSLADSHTSFATARSSSTSHGSANNLSARGVACLAGSLLGAYVTFLTPTVFPDAHSNRATCRSLAALTYFSLLLAFLWMFTLSFDIWRTLRMATCQLRAPITSPAYLTRRFAIYATACFALATLAALAAVSLDLLIDFGPVSLVPEWLMSFRPQLGSTPDPVCWFGKRRALFAFFGIPVTLIMTLNVCFFIHASAMVLSTSARSSRHSGGESRKIPGGSNSISAYCSEPTDQTQTTSTTNFDSKKDSNDKSSEINANDSSADSSKQHLTQTTFASNNMINTTEDKFNQDDDTQIFSDSSDQPPSVITDNSKENGEPEEIKLSNEDKDEGEKLSSMASNQKPTRQRITIASKSDGNIYVDSSIHKAHQRNLSLNRAQHLSACLTSVIDDYRVYLRLSTMMGLTWLVGVAAAFFGDQWPVLWYASVVLNSLQGVMVFIAFGCKRSKFATVKLLSSNIRYAYAKMHLCSHLNNLCRVRWPRWCLFWHSTKHKSVARSTSMSSA